MNHRTGRLTWRDFNQAHDQPAPTFFTGPIEVDSDFGVVNPGRTFHQPSRIQRTPKEQQDRKERLQSIAFAIFLGVLGAWVVVDSLVRAQHQ